LTHKDTVPHFLPQKRKKKETKCVGRVVAPQRREGYSSDGIEREAQ